MQIIRELIDLLRKIERHLQLSNILHKEILTTKEAALYLGISPSQLYKLNMKSTFDPTSPEGKLLYYRKAVLEEWMLKNHSSSEEEVRKRAQNFRFRPST